MNGDRDGGIGLVKKFGFFPPKVTGKTCMKLLVNLLHRGDQHVQKLWAEQSKTLTKTG